MYDYLDAKRFPEQDNCDVLLETVPDGPAVENASTQSFGWGKNTISIGTAGFSLWILLRR